MLHAVYKTTMPKVAHYLQQGSLDEASWKAKIRTLNNVSILLSLDESEEESAMTDSDNAVEESPITPSSNCTLEESPMMTNSDPDSPEAESPMRKSSKTNDQE